MASVSAQGVDALAWVEVADKDQAPRLMVQVGDLAPVAVQDPAGAPGTDPETPPKLVAGEAGEFLLVYQISKPDDPGKGETSLRISRTVDDGRHWTAPVTVVDDGLWGAYRNDHALHRSTDGRLYVAWLDGRDTDHVQLRVAASGDGGASWGPSAAADADSPCECCRMALASAAGGQVYLAWRRKLPGGVRDMVSARSGDGGRTWSPPARIHADDWQVDGCPDAGPALVADARGRLHFAWWTGRPGAAGVKYTSSDDGGLHWREPVVLKVAPESQASHVQIALAGDGLVYVAWEDGTLQLPRVLVAVSRNRGEDFGAPVAMSPADAPASHPVIASGGGRLVLTWLQRAAPDAPATVQVRTAGQAQASTAVETFHALATGAVLPRHRLQPLRGRADDIRSDAPLTLLNLWATDCLPCRHELPELQRLYEDWQARGLRVVCVSAEHGREARMQRMLAEAAPGISASVDASGGLALALHAAGLPETYVFDAAGKLLWHHSGAISAGDPGLLDLFARVLRDGPTVHRRP